MSQSPNDANHRATTDLSESERYVLLSARRRRTAMAVLDGGATPISLTDLAVEIAVRETGDVVVDRGTVEDVRIELHHCHLPKMADMGVIDYDRDGRRVTYRVR